MGKGLHKEKIMKCVICKNGEVKSGTTTITLERDEKTFVFKKVPARICENCGEEYLNKETSEHLLTIAESDALQGVQVDIRQYKAA